ncbi:MAG: amino acid adenylation domain-containing protein [Candidatus Acidiferrum sp.]
MNYNLAAPFYDCSEKYPENIALSVADRAVSYAELRSLVQPVAAWLREKAGGSVTRVGILASRSLETYVGILATCWAGGTYVPLSPKLPEERLLQLLERTGLKALIIDRDSRALLSDRILRKCPSHILMGSGQSDAARQESNSVFESAAGLPAFDSNDKPVSVAADHTVYILFTSGTTGVPKGVMIPAGGVAHLLQVMLSRYDIGPGDRVAGVTEITFDLSVVDMFMTWSRGAALFVVPATQMMAPLQCIRQNATTLVFTVPSVAAFMIRMKLLAPGSMPTLRHSLFAGEPLPVSTALAWQKAAPNSVLDNVYGPTEATVVCTGQRFTSAADATPARGVVAIGIAFPGMDLAIVDSALNIVTGKQGEIVISGPQLSTGYFGDLEQSSVRYPTISGKRWYRSGDLGYQDDSGTFHHLGRLDNQVKVRGMRVELEEIEAHLREIYHTDSVAAIAWPVEHGSAAGIVAFISGQIPASDSTQKALLKARLPSYMVPTAVHHVDSLPLNANGKVNRKDLVTLLGGKNS